MSKFEIGNVIKFKKSGSAGLVLGNIPYVLRGIDWNTEFLIKAVYSHKYTIVCVGRNAPKTQITIRRDMVDPLFELSIEGTLLYGSN